jgi:osmoprotectant transport system permease protein
MFNRRARRWLVLAAFTAAYVVLLSQTGWWQSALHFFFPDRSRVLYPTADLLALVGEHMELVGISSLLTVLIGVPVGIWVTRPSGRSFLPIVSDLTSFGQTFPPVAVLALAVPLFGFGLVPTVIALFLYGLLPVIRNTVAGLTAVPRNMVEVAYGMGMGRFQTLVKVELPLAARVILAGIRVSVVINVGTAMIGAVIGAGGLGSPIIAGLVQLNTAYVIEGAVPAALLAVLLDQLLANVEKTFAYYPDERTVRA